MHPIFDRREFLKHSAAISAALAAANLIPSATQAADEPAKKGSAADRVRVCQVGVRGQGSAHLSNGWAGRNNCEVVTICDVDEDVIGPAMKIVEAKQGKAPAYQKDIRKVLEDKSIDVVSIATPNHWHALAAIWALQAGKDVYVEKPVSHNVSEGRRIVEAARKYGRVCQTGTQSRSMTGMRQAIDAIHAGKIGKVSLAYGVCYKRRNSIGKVTGEQPLPKKLDYDLWCGPAPKKPLMRSRLHYDWHWVWDTGNGDLGNQGIHEMDKARWGLQKMELPRSVVSIGGRLGYIDDGETANTQLCVFDYGDAELIFEVRGLESTDPYPGKAGGSNKKGNFVGNIWYGSNGIVVCPSYSNGMVLSPDGEIVEKFTGGTYSAHFDNFLAAVRGGRKIETLHADILEGHLSSALCHLANISYRLGSEQPLAAAKEALSGDKQAAAALERMVEHLKANQVVLEKTPLRVGPKLTIDTKTERFVGNAAADAMLTREYRKGFEVPASL